MCVALFVFIIRSQPDAQVGEVWFHHDQDPFVRGKWLQTVISVKDGRVTYRSRYDPEDGTGFQDLGIKSAQIPPSLNEQLPQP